MHIEEFKRFQYVAQQTVLESLSFADIVVVQYDEIAFLDYSIVTTMDQSVLEEPGFLSGSVQESAGLTRDLEVRSDFVFANDDEFLAVAAQALKPLVDDVALPLDVRWPGLTFLFEPGIRCSPRHGGIIASLVRYINVATGSHRRSRALPSTAVAGKARGR